MQADTGVMRNGHANPSAQEKAGHSQPMEDAHVAGPSKSSARRVTEADIVRAGQTARKLLDNERCSEEQAADLLHVLMSAVLGASGGDDGGSLVLAPCPSPADSSTVGAGLSSLVDQVRAFMCRVGHNFFTPLELLTDPEPHPVQDKGEEGTEPADVWAAGSLLYYVLSGRTLWAPHPAHQAEQSVIREEGFVDLFTEPWPGVSPDARLLLARMLRMEPANRASAAEVMGHKWLRESRGSVPAASSGLHNGVKAQGCAGLSGGGRGRGSPLGGEAPVDGDLVPTRDLQQQTGAGGFALRAGCKKPKAAFSFELRVVGERERDASGHGGAEKGQRGASWRRGSTDFEVFSTAMSNDLAPTPPAALMNTTPTSIMSAPWKLALSAMDGEDSAIETESESPSISRLERSFSGGSVVEKEDDEDEAQRERSVSFSYASAQHHAASISAEARSSAGPTKPKSSLKSSLKSSSSYREPSRASIPGPEPAELGRAGADSPSTGQDLHAEGAASSDETEAQNLKEKRRAERVGSVRFSTVPARSSSKSSDVGGGGEDGEGDTKAESKPHRSIRDLFPMEDREKIRDETANAPSRVAPAPLTPTKEGGKKEPERRGIMRITSASAADSFLRKFQKDKHRDKDSGSFKESGLDSPTVKTGKAGSAATPDSGGKSKKPMLGSLRSFMKRSNGENKQQAPEEVEEEIVSSDYAAALASASRRVERDLLNSVRPGRRAIPMPTARAADIIPPETSVPTPPKAAYKAVPPPAEPTTTGNTVNAAETTPGSASVASQGEEGSKEADPNSIEVDELVALVEVGDQQVGNLLEDFSAILIKEQEEAAKNGGQPEVALPPLSFLDTLGEDEEEKERQSMIVDNMGRRLLQGPMTVAHPKRRHGRSSHVFC